MEHIEQLHKLIFPNWASLLWWNLSTWNGMCPVAEQTALKHQTKTKINASTYRYKRDQKQLRFF